MLTPQKIQQYVRIAIYLVIGGLGNYGITVGTWEPVVLAAGALVANFLWTMYGTRMNALIAEISQYARLENSPVQGVITTNTPEGVALAKDTPGPVVVAGSREATQVAKA